MTTDGWEQRLADLGQAREVAEQGVQLCPKCNGQGMVAKPPWVPGDVHTWNSGTTAPHRCNLCEGRMVIPHDPR